MAEGFHSGIVSVLRSKRFNNKYDHLCTWASFGEVIKFERLGRCWRYDLRKAMPEAVCDGLNFEKCSSFMRKRNSRLESHESRHDCHSAEGILDLMFSLGYGTKGGTKPGIPGTSSITEFVDVVVSKGGRMSLLLHLSASSIKKPS